MRNVSVTEPTTSSRPWDNVEGWRRICEETSWCEVIEQQFCSLVLHSKWSQDLTSSLVAFPSKHSDVPDHRTWSTFSRTRQSILASAQSTDTERTECSKCWEPSEWIETFYHYCKQYSTLEIYNLIVSIKMDISISVYLNVWLYYFTTV